MMNTVSYGDIRLPDVSADDYRHIDNDCAACLYEAGKKAVDDALAAVIRNELTATEQTAVRLYWFERKKMSQIALITGVSDDAVRKALRRAGKKIYQCLKYVILYDELVGRQDRLPEDFSFKIISCIDGKELIS